MAILTGINIRKDNQFVYGDAHGIYLLPGDKILLETENGLEAGIVIDKEKTIQNPKIPSYKIIRKINDFDLKKIKENSLKEQEALKICNNKIAELDISMNITSLQYTFDRNKLFIYYTAEKRVDFRNLIKDLALHLRTKIQMVQIGVRDETKIIGGYGHCGRQLCCASFLKEFKPVVIEMAKEQNMSLNSSKISGVCGRLICCLSYENCFYQEMKKKFPNIGENIKTPDGIGNVKNINILKEEIDVIFEDGVIKKYTLDQIKRDTK